MVMEVRPVTLTGSFVRLEPLELKHVDELAEAARSEAINWQFLLMKEPPTTIEAMGAWVQHAINERDAGRAIPFAIIERASGIAIGSTRYFDFSLVDYSMEIGFTWLTGRVHRSGINKECKYLLLKHAFEDMKALRVQFKIDSRNAPSLRAVESLGAIKEGVFRNHRLLPDGYRRTSVYYSVIDSDWPAVKAHLEANIQLHLQK